MPTKGNRGEEGLPEDSQQHLLKPLHFLLQLREAGPGKTELGIDARDAALAVGAEVSAAQMRQRLGHQRDKRVVPVQLLLNLAFGFLVVLLSMGEGDVSITTPLPPQVHARPFLRRQQGQGCTVSSSSSAWHWVFTSAISSIALSYSWFSAISCNGQTKYAQASLAQMPNLPANGEWSWPRQTAPPLRVPPSLSGIPAGRRPRRPAL